MIIIIMIIIKMIVIIIITIIKTIIIITIIKTIIITITIIIINHEFACTDMQEAIILQLNIKTQFPFLTELKRYK